MKKPWVQIALDTLTVKEGVRLAEMAVRIDVDWIEVGTPLIVYGGIDSIREIVARAGGRPVVADLKAADAVYKYFARAAEMGADKAVVLGTMDDGTIKEAVRAGADKGIGIIADMLAVPHNAMVQRAKHLVSLGVDYIMIHLGFDEMKYDSTKHTYDMVSEVVDAVTVPVGVGTLRLEDAQKCVQLGASWVVQGNPILSEESPEENMRRFVDAIRSLRND